MARRRAILAEQRTARCARCGGYPSLEARWGASRWSPGACSRSCCRQRRVARRAQGAAAGAPPEFKLDRQSTRGGKRPLERERSADGFPDQPNAAPIDRSADVGGRARSRSGCAGSERSLLLQGLPCCLADPSGEATRVLERPCFPAVDVGVDHHVFDRAVLRPQSRRVSVHGFVTGQPAENVLDDILIDMEVANEPAEVLLR